MRAGTIRSRFPALAAIGECLIRSTCNEGR